MVKSGAAPSEENVAAEGEAQILVSEFPPPPYYYQHAERLTPPPIPQDALTRGTQRAARMAAKGRAESERMRLGDTEADKTDAILGGVSETQDEEDSGDVVAVFGEIVEDPWQIQPIDPCEDPTKIRDEVKRLNSQVIQGFVKLLQDLVHRPGENKVSPRSIQILDRIILSLIGRLIENS